MVQSSNPIISREMNPLKVMDRIYGNKIDLIYIHDIIFD